MTLRWCMHFVAMLAYRLPLVVRYELPTTLLSMLAGELSLRPA